MLNYHQFEKAVFDWLMLRHQEDKTFTFSVRQKATKGAERDYFIGTESSKYFGTTFWVFPVGFPGSAGDLIDLVFKLDENGYQYSIEFNQTKEPQDDQNRLALEFIRQAQPQMKEVFGLAYESDAGLKMEKYITRPIQQHYTDLDDLFRDVELDLKKLFGIVDPLLKQFSSENKGVVAHRITKEEFDLMLDKMQKRFDKYANRPGKAAGTENQAGESEPEQTAGDTASLNHILYGPPGTGKTYKLLQLYEQYTSTHLSQTQEAFYRSLVESRTFWEILAIILLEKKKARVPELREHPLIVAKFATTEIQHPNQRLWSSLQIHTVEDCPNVRLNRESRHGVSIFFKEEDSVWRLNDEASFRVEFPELVQLFEAYKSGPGAGKTEKRFAFITCHQSLAYEDFIEGIKPALEYEDETAAGAALDYQVQKGIFFEACDEAARLAGYDNLRNCLEQSAEERARAFEAIQNNPEKQFALFLDEINRANVAAVFGELITLLEADKRLGQTNEIVIDRLPYSKRPFGVPPNLHVYGAMNTADRSVEALDTALRRRFSFEEMPPQPELLEPLDDLDLSQMLETINRRIEILLDRDHRIGHAYFMQIATAENPLEALKQTFQRNIIPLLQEYFYGDYAKIGAVLGEAFVEKPEQADQRAFAKGNWDIDAADYRPVYRLKDVENLEISDFITIYAAG